MKILNEKNWTFTNLHIVINVCGGICNFRHVYFGAITHFSFTFDSENEIFFSPVPTPFMHSRNGIRFTSHLQQHLTGIVLGSNKFWLIFRMKLQSWISNFDFGNFPKRYMPSHGTFKWDENSSFAQINVWMTNVDCRIWVENENENEKKK